MRVWQATAPQRATPPAHTHPPRRGYLVQDALYLRAYARVLAAVASRAPRPEWVQLFLQSAVSAAQAEASFHRQFFAWFGTTPEAELAGAAPHPTNLLYTSWLLRTVNETPFYEGLAAVFPCFIVYARVGDVLKQRGEGRGEGGRKLAPGHV